MSQIQIEGLNFSYEGGARPIFQNLTLTLDTDWRLGVIGPNGSGKSTLLRLLAGQLDSGGAIRGAPRCALFPIVPPQPAGRTALQVAREAVAPFGAMEQEMERLLARADGPALERYGELEQRYASLGGYQIDSHLTREADRLEIRPDALCRPFEQLSGGEQVKLLLAALFLRRDHFLLIDEPTDHLDLHGRALLGRYLAGKRGFVLVTHDRALLDAAADHILSLRPGGAALEQGNYTSWKENRDRRDAWEQAQDHKLRGEIRRMEQAAARAADWARQTEAGKYGSRNSGLRVDRGFVGAKAARMMQSAKNLERRQQRAIEEKRALLREPDPTGPLKLARLQPSRPRLLWAEDLTVDYGAGPLFAPVRLTLCSGQRLALLGPNGSGKTSLLNLILGQQVPHRGDFWRQPGLEISFLPQSSQQAVGPLRDWPRQRGIDPALFFAILRKLGFAREVFELDAADCSQGQKRKLLLAAALARPAHLLIWDEPLNYLDILSREQVEELLCTFAPTILFTEHDARFIERVATDRLVLRPD